MKLRLTASPWLQSLRMEEPLPMGPRSRRILSLSLAFQAQSLALAHPRNERSRAAGGSPRARALTGAALSACGTDRVYFSSSLRKIDKTSGHGVRPFPYNGDGREARAANVEQPVVEVKVAKNRVQPANSLQAMRFFPRAMAGGELVAVPIFRSADVLQLLGDVQDHVADSQVKPGQ